jgi:hypothetical protein
MKRERFEVWLRNIYSTQDSEISCTECFELISGFVEVEVAGANVVAALPHLKQHLEQCRACRDEYETLLDLRYVEENKGLPLLQELQDLIR